MLRRSAVLLAVVGCLSALVVAGCGSSSSSSSTAAVSQSSTPAGTTTSAGTTHLATTKFVLHFGLAAGAFHRYIYKPFKAGAFGKPLSHKLALLKGAAAALFAYHELKLAVTDAQSSKILHPLVAPLTLLGSKLAAMKTKLLGGGYNPADINAVQTAGGSIAAAAGSKGITTGDIASKL